MPPISTPQFLKRCRKMDLGTWRAILRQGGCCYCDAMAETIEHVIPRSSGGEPTADNEVGACQRCNGERGSTPLLLFLITRHRPGYQPMNPPGPLARRRLAPELPPIPPLTASIEDRLVRAGVYVSGVSASIFSPLNRK
jgi:hypothetical protein